MGSRLSNGEVMRGIFIKHILEDSPAGHNGTLKTGDRILQVTHTPILRHKFHKVLPNFQDACKETHSVNMLYVFICMFLCVFQVDGVDLRDASHEQAVDAIRKAGNPVVFLVQSIISRPRVSE